MNPPADLARGVAATAPAPAGRGRRLVAIAVGLVGIAALVLGLWSRRWVIGTDFGIETHVGLHEMELCQVVQPELDKPGEEVCSTVSHADIARSPSKLDGFDTFSLVSRITFYTGLGAAGVMLLVIGLALARVFPATSISPSTLAILVTVGTVVLIAITLAIHPWKEIGWGTGYSIFLAGGGATACLFSAILLGRVRPAVADYW